MSRLPFGPEPDDMEVTDIATGHFVFAPVEGEAVSFADLDGAISGAGYEIEDASIALSGKVAENGHLATQDGQVFHLSAADEGIESELSEIEPDTELYVQGAWQVREGAEVVVVRRIGEATGERAAGGEEGE